MNNPAAVRVREARCGIRDLAGNVALPSTDGRASVARRVFSASAHRAGTAGRSVIAATGYRAGIAGCDVADSTLH